MSVLISTCSVLMLLCVAQLHCAFDDCPEPGVYIHHKNNSGHLIKCKSINCGPDYEVEICTTECEHDWCRQCYKGKTQPEQINSSVAEKHRCIDEESCKEDLEHVPDNRLQCRCALSKGYYGNDPTNCMFHMPPCAKGTELMTSGACLSCRPGWFKGKDGPSLCIKQTNCKAGGLDLIREGNATDNNECSNTTEAVDTGSDRPDSADKIIIPTPSRPDESTDDSASCNSWIIAVVVVIVIGFVAFGIIVLCKLGVLTAAKMRSAVICFEKSHVSRLDNDMELAEIEALHPETPKQDQIEANDTAHSHYDTPTTQLDIDSVESIDSVERMKGQPTKLAVALPKQVVVVKPFQF